MVARVRRDGFRGEKPRNLNFVWVARLENTLEHDDSTSWNMCGVNEVPVLQSTSSTSQIAAQSHYEGAYCVDFRILGSWVKITWIIP